MTQLRPKLGRRRWLSRRRALLLLIQVLSTNALAQTSTVSDVPSYSLLAMGSPLSEALDALVAKTQISLAYDAELVRGKKAFCRIIETDVEGMLRCVLTGTGLDFHRLSSGTYVVREAIRVESPGTIVGRVIDASTGQPISGANIVLPSGGNGAASNAAGRFALSSIDPGRHTIVVTHVAYHDMLDSVYVSPFGRADVSLSLAPRTRVVAPIVVNGFRQRLPSSASVYRIDLNSNLSQMSGRGSSDILANVDAVSGVRFGDALSDVHVQGGAAGEHQYLLDGATLFVPLRNGGFVGPFSPFAVRQITVQKAGYGVAHGSHLSGVVEIEQETGSNRRFQAVVQADEMAVNGRISGHIGRDGALRATWMIGGRTDLWDLFQPSYVEHVINDWSRPDSFLAAEIGQSPIHSVQEPHVVDFSDVHASVRIDLGPATGLRFARYVGTNHFGNDFEPGRSSPESIQDAYSWRNAVTSLDLESALSGRLLARLAAWSSYYEMQHPFERSSPTLNEAGQCVSACTPIEADDFNDVEEAGIRSRIDVAASSHHTLSFGAEAERTASEMSISIDPYGVRTALGADHHEIGVWRFSGFVEDEWTLTHSAELRVGSRFTWLGNDEGMFAEPRVAFRYDRALERGGSWAVEAAAGLYRQYLHQFDVATFGPKTLLPTIRFWQPVATEERPPKAIHLTGSFLLQPNEKWQFVVETFYKRLPHIRDVNYVSPTLLESEDVLPPDLFVNAKGQSHGLSAALERSSDRIKMGAYYDFESTRRKVDNRFRGSWQPVPWNVPHTLRLSVDAMPYRNVSTTLRWRSLFGRSWALRQGYYDYLEPNVETQVFGDFDLTDPSSHRLPVFSQLDVGAAYSFVVYRSSAQLFVQILNVLDRKNELDWWLTSDADRQNYHAVARTWISRAVSVSLKLSI